MMCDTPVSYTHLDVYKRQVEYRLLQETCILDKNEFYLFVIRYED